MARRPDEWYIRRVSDTLVVEIDWPKPEDVAIGREGGGLVVVTQDELRELARVLPQVVKDIDAYMAESNG